MWSVSLKHYKCKEDSSGSYIIHDGRLRAGYARVVTRQGVEWRKMTKNTWQYFEDEADYRLLLVSMQVSIIILILRAESPILGPQVQCTMIPLSTRSCLKSNKLRPILNGQFCHAISKNIGLKVLGSKQPREILVFVILISPFWAKYAPSSSYRRIK